MPEATVISEVPSEDVVSIKRNKTRILKWLLPRTILFLIIIALLFYTIKTAWVLIQDYAQSPTSYTQETLFNDSIALPRSKVCLPLSSFELDEYWTNSTDISSSENAIHYQQLLLDYLDSKTITKESLLDANQTWPHFFLFIVHHYLNITMQYEALHGQEVMQDHYLSFIAEFQAVYGDETINQMDTVNSSYNDLVTSINILDDRMTGLNISVYELKLKYGLKLTALFHLDIAYWEYTTEYNDIDIDISSFSSFELDSICFILRFDEQPLKRKESIMIYARRTYLPNPRPNPKNNIMTLGIGGRLSYGLYNEYVYSKFNSYIRVFPLQVKSTFRSVPSIKGKIRCSENKTLDEATSECQRKYLQEKCGCIPTSGYAKLAYNESSCKLNNYKNCFNAESALNSEEAQVHLIQCEKNSVDICDRTTYFNPPSSSHYYWWWGDEEDMAVIELGVASFDYPIYEEVLKWTFPSFIGVLGGALGLWLGINILDTIGYLTSGAEVLTEARKRKTANETTAATALKVTKSRDFKRVIYGRSAPPHWKTDTTTSGRCFSLCTKYSKWIVSSNVCGWSLRILLIIFSLVIIGLAEYEYLNQRTTTAVYVEHKQSMSLPAATICLPLEFGELDEFHMKNKNKNKYTTALAAYFNERNVTKDDIMPTDRRWNNTVRLIAHAYLIELSNCESGDFSEECNSILADKKDLIVAMDMLESLMIQLNISIEELRQRFGIEVAALYYFQVSFYDFLDWIKYINITRTKYIGQTVICYEMPFDQHPLKSISYIKINASEYTLPNPIYIGSQRDQIRIDMQNRLSSYSLAEYESILRSPFGGYYDFLVELTMFHRLREVKSGEIRCGELTLVQCESICRINYIQDQCKCMPTSWPSLLKYVNKTASVTCDKKIYESCMNISAASAVIEGCASRCLKPCERLDVKSADNINLGGNNISTVVIQLNIMDLVTFEEELTWSLEEFFGEIGGIVGFLLGYSIFDVLCFIFLLLLGFSAFLLRRAKVAFKKESKIEFSMVKPRSYAFNGNTKQVAENSADVKKSSKLVVKLKKIGWNIDHPQWIAEQSFKLLMIIFFIGLTVKMCLPVILTFAKGNTISVINLALNQPLYLKPASVCVDLDTADLNKMRYANLSTTYYEDSIQEYFNQSNITKESFLGSMKWTDTLRYQVYDYLTSLAAIEMGTGNKQTDLIRISSLDPTLPSYSESLGRDKYRAFLLLERNMNLLQISIEELRQKLGREMAAIFSLNVWQTTNCTGYATCQNKTEIPIDEVTWLNWNRICYKLPLDRFPFEHPKQTLIVTANTNSLANKILADSTRLLRIYLSGKNNSFTNTIYENAYFVYAPFSFEYLHRVSISTEYKSMISLGKCSEYRTREVCVAECRVALFQQMCNCTPTLWSSWISLETYNECKLSNYSSCVNYTGNADGLCRKEKCDSQILICDRPIFDVKWLDSNYAIIGTARLTLEIASFDYPVFKEQYELSFEEFTGVLGGALGFYLPLDFITISLIFINIFTFVNRSLFNEVKE